jgi:hypothetical protein
MYSKTKILGVGSEGFRMAPREQDAYQVSARMSRGNPTRIDASLFSGAIGASGGSGASLSVNSFWQSNYQYMMTGLLPADPHLIDTSTLQLFYRDIYLFDSVAGSMADLISTFPFSNYKLSGLDDRDLDYYSSALERLDIKQMLPTISLAHLVDGFFCGSLVFDPNSKEFIDTMIHDALSVAAIPSPFWNIDPTLNVRVGQATQQFMHDTSEYARRYLDTMPSQFIEMLRSGAFTLDPVTTLFVPRRSTTDRAYTSFMHRILPMYLYEKTLYRGTLTEAQRRQRAMTHVTAGDENWTPTGEELFALVREFQSAEADPLGGWVATRNAVQTVDVRPGGEMWRWDDVSEALTPMKLRAMGTSEAFLAGDASYAAGESAYSSFLESMDAYRNKMTYRVFESKIFPLVAVVNNLYKESARQRAKPGHIIDFLFNAANRQSLKMPILQWEKDLSVNGEENTMEMLEMASAKGVPIPMKMWMAAAGIDPDSLERDLVNDPKYRQFLSKLSGKDTSYAAEQPLDGGNGGWINNDGGERMLDLPDQPDIRGNEGEPDIASLLNRVDRMPTTASMRWDANTFRAGLGSREFPDMDSWRLTKTGRVASDPHPVTARRNFNDMIFKIARDVNRDPNYRETLKRRNREKGVRDPINGGSF